MVGIVTNTAALFAQRNLETANTNSESSIARLSSGQRIIKASDDVSGLAVGTVLATTTNTLRTVLQSASQASSLLQIADGGYQNISEILQRQLSLSVQANSGAISDNERAFLNAEFQNLTSEIDRLVDSTNFNGIKLLDGSIFDAVELGQSTDVGGVAGTTLNFTSFTAAADSITINYEGFTTTLTAVAAETGIATDFVAGATINESLNNLVSKLNGLSANLAGEAAGTAYNYEVNGNNLVITAKTSGESYNSETFVLGGAAAAGGSLTISGGAEGSLSNGSVDFTGTIGDNLLTAANGQLGTGSLDFTQSSIIANGETLDLGDGAANNVQFTFRDAASYATNNSDTDVLIGGSIDETIDNLIGKINTFDAGVLSYFNFTRSNDALNIEAQYYGTDEDPAAASVGPLYNNFDLNTFAVVGAFGDATITGTNVTNAIVRNDYNAGTPTFSGIDVTGVSGNPAFAGTISGFEATYTGTNTANITLNVGEIQYRSDAVNTNPSGDTVIRFSAVGTAGGFFDLAVAGGQGEVVNNQGGADAFAARLDAAFASVTFQQRSEVESFVAAGDLYNGTTRIGTLTGATIETNLNSAEPLDVIDVRVTASADPAVSDATIEIETQDGRVFRSQPNIGRSIGQVVLQAQDNPADQIIFTAGDGGNGRGSIRLGNPDDARVVENALEDALGIGQGASALNFQVGTESNDNIKVALQNASTSNLYRDENGASVTLDISTAAGATQASAVLDNAINTVIALRAEVGSLQSRFDFVSNNVTTAIENSEAARSGFLDVDVAGESTRFASAQVRLQASISVLAQANQLPQNLLKLIG